MTRPGETGTGSRSRHNGGCSVCVEGTPWRQCAPPGCAAGKATLPGDLQRSASRGPSGLRQNTLRTDKSSGARRGCTSHRRAHRCGLARCDEGATSCRTVYDPRANDCIGEGDLTIVSMGYLTIRYCVNSPCGSCVTGGSHRRYAHNHRLKVSVCQPSISVLDRSHSLPQS